MDFSKLLFPTQSIGTKAAEEGFLGLGGMMGGLGDIGQNQMLLGLLGPMLLGGMGQGRPEQSNYVEQAAPDQFLTGGQAPGQPMGQAQGQQMDPLDMLSKNIARRFGG